MATSTGAGAGKMASRLILLALASSLLVAVRASDLLFAMTSVPEWQKKSEMTLQLTAPDGAVVPLTYGAVPLTRTWGANGTTVARNVSDYEMRDWKTSCELRE